MKTPTVCKAFFACVIVSLSCGGAIAKSTSHSSEKQIVTKTVQIAPLDKNSSRYIYLPFRVPPRSTRIDVSYSYDRANETNVLDIGVFDSCSSQSNGDVVGFRGWSGGRRNQFFISRETATPGYLPGTIPAGTWRIILGLYRVNPAGVQVTFKIETQSNEEKATKVTALSEDSSDVSFFGAPVVPRTESPLRSTRAVPRWVKGDLHIHSVHSDGDRTIAQIVSSAREAGLDFISITDHNTTSHHSEIDRLGKASHGLLVIRGEEITTYGGHANAWGLPANTLIDFRVSPGDIQAMSRTASQTHLHGGLISINHPFALCAGCNWSYDNDAMGFDAIEVWNGSWDQTDEQALVLWDRLLQKGRRITAVASSDSHSEANPIGRPTTHVQLDNRLSEQAILKSINAGQAFITRSANAPFITLLGQSSDAAMKSIGQVIRLSRSNRVHFTFSAETLPDGARISLVSNGITIRSFSANNGRASRSLDVDYNQNGYFRLEVRDQSGSMLALTNPIYVEVEKRQ